jgi:small subunit ribosomal protein S21
VQVVLDQQGINKMKVEVRNNNVDRAMQVLKRKLVDEGVFKELQERRFYEKPSDRKRRLKRAAIAREKRRTKD